MENLPALESLRASLRQREGELLAIRSKIADLESVRNSLTDELVALKGDNQKLYSYLSLTFCSLFFFADYSIASELNSWKINRKNLLFVTTLH
jgi:hypothetical protein